MKIKVVDGDITKAFKGLMGMRIALEVTPKLQKENMFFRKPSMKRRQRKINRLNKIRKMEMQRKTVKNS